MAQQTVIGVFDSADDAQRAVRELSDAGFNRESVDLASRSSQSGTSGASYGSSSGTDSDHYNASGTMVEGAADRVGRAFESDGSGRDSDHYNKSGTMVEGAADAVGRAFEGGRSTGGGTNSNDVNRSGTMVEGAADAVGRGAEQGGSAIGRFFKNLFGDDDDTYGRYNTVAERAQSIVTVHAHSEENAQQAADIMDRCGAVDVDERASQYGYTGNTRQNTVGASSGLDTARTADADQKVQVIQEDLQIGKREVSTGGARLRSRVVSRPVEESLRLREEHVFVNRERVDRPASDADFNAFREGTVELTETAEVPVVQKEARVVEEVSLGKQVEERTETIRDSVRSTEVEVERIEGQDVRSTGTTGRTDSSVDQ